MSAPRPDQETWDTILEAFTFIGESAAKVAKATRVDAATVRQAWAKGWGGVPGRRAAVDSVTGERIPPVAAIPALLPIKDILERANLHAKAAREKIYRATVDTQERLVRDAHDDALRQRALEAVAVRTSMMLADQSVKNALDIQLASRSLHEALAVRMQELASDPDARVGSILKSLREAAEIGRLATQQLEAAQALEQKFTGSSVTHFDGAEKKSPTQLVSELRRLLLAASSEKTEALVLDAEVVVMDLATDAASRQED